MKKVLFSMLVLVLFMGCSKESKEYFVQYRVSGGCLPGYVGTVTITYLDGTGNTQVEAVSHNLSTPWTKNVTLKSGQTATVSVYPNNVCPDYGLYFTSLYINSTEYGSESRTTYPTMPEVDTTTYLLP